ncbi:prolyl oligopeptidase family serine peptidase [Hyphobacterium sp. HN65]|uniref:Prolyl oligopeptidase family serine peptidase n=1 Tax=Hyphobacterium lacteum TaxID=3116575 RepID=A0ABU7LTN5_9PROT|nr:prolyl oligopeptidase family serine peptidase [Hyphobacterium sp. HN65]MEE2526709.1 prolyl oligopeptidase family serine peptidase [Hyphobacterium sp. HN65]
MFRQSLAAAALAGVFTIAAFAQDEAYRLPPQDIVDIVDAPAAPWTSLSPDRRHLLLIHRENLPPVSELARPMERLAGLRLDASTNGRHGPRTAIGLSVIDISSGEERAINLPDDVGLSNFDWSPDGRYAAFVVADGDELSLWVADVHRARAREVISGGLNAVFDPVSWMPDSQTLLVHTIPADRGPMPERPVVPAGPVIQVADGYEAPVRTYQDLLEDAHDAALFAWMAETQLVLVNANRGRPRPVGEPGLIYSADPAPGGEMILIGAMEQPFSYDVPWSSFADRTYVIGLDGNEIAEIARQPIADNVPIGGVITGRRNVGWQASHPSRIIWSEALDGGDPRVEAVERDSVWMLDAPFDGEPVEVARFEDRYYGTQFTSEGQTGLAVEYDRDTRIIRRWVIDFANPGGEMRLAEERNLQDSYANPGSPETTRNEFGQSVAAVEDGYLYYTGDGSTPEGDRPFLRRVSFETFEAEEIWRNSGENYEEVIGLVSPDAATFLTSYQDPVTPPNVRLHGEGEARFITDFANPHPQLNEISRELITYEREDGVSLSATLYLPADYEEGETLPLLIWAYPLEYNDAATAGQVRGSPYQFTRVAGTSPRFLVTQGYALLENATMPVIGDDPETVNDTFIEQLVMSAQAAVDESVRRGFGDGERVAIAGHSYGAFMTAHLLAASDIFRTGIARSGAYNRTLTPFGFQSERRTFWQAPDVYFELSPFMHADEINEPILLIHGQLDNNSGTYPMQSERMFAAVKGNAGTARLVMLPYESHGYRGRENVLHVLAESIDWLNRWVLPEEDPTGRTPVEPEADGAGE